MAGYVRQSVANIVNGLNITAPPLNAEFNAIQTAFSGTTGHTHDGTTGNAPRVNLATSVTGFLPQLNGGVGGRNNVTATTDPTTLSDANSGYAPGSLWVNLVSGRVFLNVANAPGAAIWVESVGVFNNTITPQITNTVDIGSNTFRFRNLFLSGSLDIPSIIAGTLTVDTLSVAVNATFAATPVFNAGITVNGASQLNGNLTVTGNTQLGDATGDTINFVGRMNSSIVPDTNNTRDLGTTSLRFRDIWSAGTATFAAASVSSLTATGGTINNTVIGNATPQAITGTTITSTSGFSGNLTGNVTGNLTGNVTGAVTGNVTGNLTGNVTASSGTSTFNNVTINGTLDMNAGTSSTITGLSAPVNGSDATTKTYVDAADALKLNLSGGTMSGQLSMGNNKIVSLGTPTANADAATKLYVDTSIANLINSAPGTLDTLSEIADALGNDPNFATTITNEIATKVDKAGDTMTGNLAMSNQLVTGLGAPTANDHAARKSYVDTADALKLNLAGGTMTGAIAMSNQKITGLGTPTAGNDATTKTYVDNADALKLNLTGGTMSGVIAMGNNRITGLQDPSNAQDAATKNYIDTIFGSTVSAANSAAAALISEQNAASSASAASVSASGAATSLFNFRAQYLGPLASNPTVDGNGNAVTVGDLYFNTAVNELRVFDGTNWQTAPIVGGTVASLNTTGALTENNVPVVVQTDIGTAPNEIPLNQYLGNLAYQDAGSIAGPVVIGTDSTDAALRITQTGTGNCLVVEDSASPDSTPFVIDADGAVVMGAQTALALDPSLTPSLQRNGTGMSSSSIGAGNWSNATSSSSLFFAKSRGTSAGAHTSVQNGDSLGSVIISGSDGTSFVRAAQINTQVDATPGTGSMPGRLVFSTTPSGSSTPVEAMRINSAGDVSIGSPDPLGARFASRVNAGGTLATVAGFYNNTNSNATTGQGVRLFLSNRPGTAVRGVFLDAIHDGGTNSHAFAISTNGSSADPTERMRIDSSGNLLVGTTSAVSNIRLRVVGGGINVQQPTSTASGSNTIADNGGSPNNLRLYNDTDSNNTGNRFLICDAGASVLRAEIRSNGGLANFSGNNVNLSDRREKTNIEPAKDYLATICAIPVVTFDYIDQNQEEDPGKTLGVIAQDVEAVAPEFVMESNWGNEENPKVRKSIYQTDLTFAMMKAIQELKAELDTVKAELQTLKGN
jgi:hypothetical protein